MAERVLELEKIGKTFAGVAVLRDVNLQLQKEGTCGTAVASGGSKVHSNTDEFTCLQKAGTKVDLTSYYAQYKAESKSNITAMGGIVGLKGLPKKLPKPNKKHKLVLALYFTVDEVGVVVLDGTKKAAEKMGIEVLVNDANYDQSIQDQAIEQWILKKLKDAKILRHGGYPPLVGEANSIMTIDNVEIGGKSAQFIVDSLKAKAKVAERMRAFADRPQAA